MEVLTDADARDLSQQQISAVAEVLRENLFHFCWFIFGFRDLVPSIHGQIAQLLGLWGTPGWERIMVQIPREHFKTSVCTMGNSLWQVVRQPDQPIVIYNEKLDNAAMWVRTIRDTIASSRLFHVVFPDLTPPGIRHDDRRTMPRYWKWSDTELLLPRSVVVPETSITAMGVGAASAGRHWPKMIKDDLISEDAINSPSVMATVIDWFDRSLYLERPALKGMDLVVCTPWAYEDLYAHILRAYDYKLYRRAALENQEGEPDVISGESIFPEKLTTKELQRHHARDAFGFSSQMQCQPKAGKDQSFDEAWDRFGRMDFRDPERPVWIIDSADYSPDLVGDISLDEQAPQSVPLHQMSTTILFDPAPSEQRDIKRERHARNALVVVGHDCWGRKHILESWVGRLDPFDTIKIIFALMDKWGTDTIAIEEVIFSKLYRYWLTREAELSGRQISVKRLHPGKMDKDTRIRSRIPALRGGLYYFNAPECTPLLKEKMEYPYGSTVDCLDAWSYDDCVPRPEAPSEYQVRMEEEYGPKSTGSRGVTGYGF